MRLSKSRRGAIEKDVLILIIIALIALAIGLFILLGGARKLPEILAGARFR